MSEQYELTQEGEEKILKLDYSATATIPSIEESEMCMAKTVDILLEVGQVTKIVFYQKRDYEYDYNQTIMLLEISSLFKHLYETKKIVSFETLISDPRASMCLGTRHTDLHRLLTRKLKGDPIGCYVELRRLERMEKIRASTTPDPRCVDYDRRFTDMLQYVIDRLDETKLITLAKPHLAGYKMNDRAIYRIIFHPTVKPDFMYTKLLSTYPLDAEELDNYTIADDTEVTIFALPNSVQYLYHIMPPEFKLEEDKYEILDLARKIMAEHKPERSEFIDPQRMREVFFNVGRDLIEELVEYKHYNVSAKEVDKLARILVRYTIGFGLIEVLLQDEKVQDISVNSPMGQIPIFIVHQDFDDCLTNIMPTKTESESWASKLRMISGRPLDEANPILDTELELPGASTRVSTITKPLDPSGLAFSFRRHRDKPWTLPLFIKVGMVTKEAAGLLSFLVDGTRTMLIAGTRSSGKSSFLSSLLIEIMRRYRIITVEDTLELPTKPMRELGYNIQSMKVASALVKGSSEMSAADGIRSTLRLGDSALIVGEVRSAEAKALYEAMRVGASANVVAGTIHGDSPYGIFDRVVNDIGVPKTSFKATDVCIIANPVRSADGLHKYRRVTQITEVRKDWEEDPNTEGGFVDLMKYDAESDALQASPELLNGDSDVLKSIAANIKEFAGNWDAVWDNILLRGDLKQAQLDMATKCQNNDMLEAPFTILCNDVFHRISGSVQEEIGSLDSKRIAFEWNDWLKREVKKNNLNKSV